MSIQEYNKCTSANSVPLSISSMCEDVQTSSVNGFYRKGHGSSGDEHAPKARKPYTITKQRERWTEEEHKKFLEALQLYGRAWRRIEEFVGTKTAVQIRSHAQKFFSKVVRESKPIDIPPPRPKRKPAHPYPRKMGSLTVGKFGRSSSPTEQENGSPTSVLSAFASDNMISYLSDFPNHCTSPVTSGVGSNDQETSNEEAEEKQNQSPMEFNLCNGGLASSKETPVSCLKLFGKTVMATNANKPASSSGDHAMKNSESSSITDLDMKDTRPYICASSLPLLPMNYPLPSNYRDSMNQVMPLPWWSYYVNLQFPLIHQQNSSDRVMKKECSLTGSNTTNGENMSKTESNKGFVPYKRCVIKKVEQECQKMSNDGDDKLIELCL